MDVLQFIRQMQEIYGDELIKPASELPRPQQALDREMFETAFKDKKAYGGKVTKRKYGGNMSKPKSKKITYKRGGGMIGNKGLMYGYKSGGQV